MRCVIQRVRKAAVRVDGKTVGAIDAGFLVLLAVHRGDTASDAEWMVRKIPQLRLFADDAGKFDRDLRETGGAVLLVSQFTLYGDCRKGRRPSFSDSAPPTQAQSLFDAVADGLRTSGIRVETGVFGAHMDVELLNDGPVTVILDSPHGAAGPPGSGTAPSERDAARDAGETAAGADFSLPPLPALRELLQIHPETLLAWGQPPVLDWECLPPAYTEAIHRAAAHLKDRPEAFRDALFALLVTPQAADGLRFYLRSGILDVFIPELCETVNLSNEDDRRHKHVWDHTLQVVQQIDARLELRLAALFHDIGKARTREFTTDGKVTFYGHDRVGARLFRKIAQRLKFPPELAERVRLLVKLHLRPGQYLSSWTDSAVRRFHRELPEGILEDLLALGRADITSKRPGRREQAVAMIDELERRIRGILEEDARVPPLPTGLGNALMDELHMPAGPQLGRIMKHLAAEVESGRMERQAPFEYYISYLQKNPPEWLEMK